MRRIRVAFACALAVLLPATIGWTVGRSGARVPDASERARVVHQLRVYEIFDGSKGAFHERFRDHAMRIMARYDFRIVATWETRHGDRTEFVYLLEWPDEATMKDRWAKFLADAEWTEIKRVTNARGRIVGEIEDRTLTLTEYSPRTTLAP
ncbi:MAG TPA: NIPSNAP family protein [Gemmatimonadaceae bacterium]|nr:NIPSNAP family protein [Gemmatimonadaceae bacterium]